MTKSRTYTRVAVIFLTLGLYHLWTFFDAIHTGCLQVGVQIKCSYQNAGNFESSNDAQLLFGCLWLSAAGYFVVAAVQARKKA
ncbi:hypothetical protein DID96_19265 [Burkholderia sp. Bp8963]|uniref:hypothetical protein n=1 Tax=Burkholderia sp. Bp8963 TaxID=2184547 RepID=UPI000F5B40E4|nr:hypothetical protein [Burkholderia sp. Bp8963]RQS68724.1 hypothetical protein DID96_19265 [Burkholderia sp. Bp8963]